MKPAQKALFLLCILAGASIVEGGRGHQPKGNGRKQDSKFYGRESRYSSHEHGYFYDRDRERRESSNSRRRRRRSRSVSKSPQRRRSDDKPPRNSPGYEEYKRQKQEAAAWQERRLQAEALAMCLEEREQQKHAALAAAAMPKAPDNVNAQASVVPKLPQKQVDQSPNQTHSQELIPVSSLKLLEAELGHLVDLGNKPLSANSLESLISQPKRGLGKRLDQFITRWAAENYQALLGKACSSKRSEEPCALPCDFGPSRACGTFLGYTIFFAWIYAGFSQVLPSVPSAWRWQLLVHCHGCVQMVAEGKRLGVEGVRTQKERGRRNRAIKAVGAKMAAGANFPIADEAPLETRIQASTNMTGTEYCNLSLISEGFPVIMPVHLLLPASSLQRAPSWGWNKQYRASIFAKVDDQNFRRVVTLKGLDVRGDLCLLYSSGSHYDAMEHIGDKKFEPVIAR
eukprot:s1618_g1.t1